MKYEEIVVKAKEAQSAEELIALAKENGMEMTEESAAAYYEAMHKSGELADDELNNVAGGWCYNDGRPVITVGEQHECFVCERCGLAFKGSDYYGEGDDFGLSAFGRAHSCKKDRAYPLTIICNCGNCKYCIYEKGLWLCDNPENKK